MIKSKKHKKYQFGGQLYDLMPKLDKFEYTPWYAKKDTGAITNIVGSLQNIYENRLAKKEAAVKAINDLELNPMYAGLKKEMLGSLTSGLKDLQDKSGNDITSDIYSKGMLDLVGNVMGDTRLNFAKENTKSYDTWKQNVEALSKEGKYNPMFDPNLNTIESMKSGKGLYDWWDVKTVTPFFDYNDKLVKIAQQVKERSNISTTELNTYSWWFTKLTSVPKDEVAAFLQAQKEGFMASPEGQTFQLVTAKKYNLKLDGNGQPIKDDNFNKVVTKEYIDLVQGIARGVSYVSVEDKKIISDDTQASMDKAALDAKAAADAAKGGNKSSGEQDNMYGLFKPGTPGTSMPQSTLPQYMIAGVNKEFDYKSSYNTKYTDYDTKYKTFKNDYQSYEFTDATGKKLNVDEVLDYYENGTGLDKLIIKSNGTQIDATTKNTLQTSLNNLIQSRSAVKAEAQYINEIDNSLKSNILSVKENYNGALKYSMINYKEEVTLGNGQKVTINGKVEKNGEVLFFVNDEDKGYKNKILTPFEFKQMYGVLPNGISESVGQEMVNYENKVNEMLKDNALDYARSHGNPDAQFLTPEMYLQYRQSEDYLHDLETVQKDAMELGGGLYSDYMAQRTDALNARNTKAYTSDNYYVIPELGEGVRFDQLRTDINGVINSKDQFNYYVIDGKGSGDKPLQPQQWNNVLNDLKQLPLQQYAWYRIFKEDVYAKGGELKIIGYDMNERLGGVYIAKVGITDAELRQMTGSENEDNEDYTTAINSLRQAQNDQIMTYDAANKMWLYKDKTLIIPSNTVNYHYFNNQNGNPDANVRVYNEIQDGFNNGKEVISLPTADGGINTVRMVSNGGFIYSYTDTDGVIKTMPFNSIEDAVVYHNGINNYTQANTTAANASVVRNGGINLNNSGNSIVNNINTGLIGNFVKEYKTNNGEAYNEIRKNNKDTDKLHINVIANNKFSIKYDTNNLASRSVLNALRHVACIDKLDQYGATVYKDIYKGLSDSQKKDLSLYNGIPQIDMSNPAQLNMLQQLFGSSNLTIEYPDNGLSDQIVITVN